MRIAYATAESARELDAEADLVRQAAEDHDHELDVACWDDPAVDWSRFDVVVVRSCWDYVARRREFLAWADQVPRLQNSARTLRWNTDKSYLRELESQGVPIIPTAWDVRTGDRLVDSREWVVKPTISAGSRDTARWSTPADVYAHSEAIRASGRTSMTQPYVASVDDEGETALLFFDGQLSHAVRKGPLLRPDEGVREDRDGRGDHRSRVPTERQQRVARHALDVATAIIGDPPLYARVDLVTAADGEPVLIELELAEPYLFLALAPDAPHDLVRAIERRTRRTG